MQADRNLCYYYAKAVPTALIPERYRSQCNVKHELTSGASVVILTMGDRSTFVKIEASDKDQILNAWSDIGREWNLDCFNNGTNNIISKGAVEVIRKTIHRKKQFSCSEGWYLVNNQKHLACDIVSGKIASIMDSFVNTIQTTMGGNGNSYVDISSVASDGRVSLCTRAKKYISTGSIIGLYSTSNVTFADDSRHGNIDTDPAWTLLEDCGFILTMTAAANSDLTYSVLSLGNPLTLMNDPCPYATSEKIPKNIIEREKGYKETKKKENCEAQFCVRLPQRVNLKKINDLEMQNVKIYVFIKATKNIKAGDELFFCYGDEYWQLWNRHKASRELVEGAIIKATCQTDPIQLEAAMVDFRNLTSTLVRSIDDAQDEEDNQVSETEPEAEISLETDEELDSLDTSINETSSDPSETSSGPSKTSSGPSETSSGPSYESKKSSDVRHLSSIKEEEDDACNTLLTMSRARNQETEKDTILAYQNTMLAHQDNMLDKKNALLAQKNASLSQQLAALADKDILLAQKDTLLAHNSAIMTHMEDMAVQKDMKIDELEKAVKYLNAECANLIDFKDKSNEYKNHLKRKIDTLQEEIHCLTSMQADVNMSRKRPRQKNAMTQTDDMLLFQELLKMDPYKMLLAEDETFRARH